MKSLQSFIGVFAITLLSTLLVLGAFSISQPDQTVQVEFDVETATNTSEPLIALADEKPIASNTLFPTKKANATPLVQVITPSPTPMNTLAVCPPPEAWVQYTVQNGDSLEALADLYDLSIEELQSANCLEVASLLPGTVIFLPDIKPTSTPSITPTAETEICGPPAGWVIYIIQYEDTLFELSLIYGVSVKELQDANCMGDSTLLTTGDEFYVPFAANTKTPTLTVLAKTATKTPYGTITPTKTPSLTKTPTQTKTYANTPTHTQTLPPTSTSLPPTPTRTFTITLTPTITATPTVTFTSTTSSTPTTTPTITETSASPPTITPTLTPKP